MSGVIVNQVRAGFYLDSVALMRFSRTIAALDGVEEAALMMGTPANRQIMTDARLLDEAGGAANGGDLVVAIRARDRRAADRAAAEAHELLDQPRAIGTIEAAWRPRSLRAAVKQVPGANLALISVPGDFAIAEARKAIRRGLHAMIFSDNVPLADEAALKAEARALGRLIMGPDCGTAIINGTPLAFANRVPRGAIGIIGASGTGTQEISSLIARNGGGVSHAIGVGGRDPSECVGGISTLMALDALEVDRATQHIVLVSKPPPAGVATRILERVAGIGKPATLCFIGADALAMPANAAQVFTLKDAAFAALGIHQSNDAQTHELAPNIRPPTGRAEIRGLFSGGTLCAEAQAILRAGGQPVISNAPIPGVSLIDGETSGHAMLDLGDDAYTMGRPHPMIDPMVRDAPILEALLDDSVGILLVDVVIGLGAHHDPAGHLATLINEHGGRDRPVVVASVTGTEADPQCRSDQVARLKAAGIHVAPSNADAAAWALSLLRPRPAA